MIIFGILLEMGGELVDLARKDGRLHFGRPRVFVMFLIIPDDAGFHSLSKHMGNYNLHK